MAIIRSLIGEEFSVASNYVNTKVSTIAQTKNINKEVFVVEGVLNYIDILVSDTLEGEYANISEVDVLCNLDTYSGDTIEKYLKISIKKNSENIIDNIKNLRKRFFLKLLNNENEVDIVKMFPNYVGDLEVIYTNEFDKNMKIKIDNIQLIDENILKSEIYPDKNGTFLLSENLYLNEEITLKLTIEVDEFFDELDEIITNGFKYNFAFEFFGIVTE